MSTLKNFVLPYWEMTKPRICVLALVMAAVGFFLGSPRPVDYVLLTWSMLGIGLLGASSGILNQYMERELDAQMWRTLNRPLPSGRLAPARALWVGWGMAIGGVVVLLFFSNPVTTVLGALTLLFYLGVYTPAKRVSSMSTLVGAIPGAMPPLLGWTAGHGSLGGEGWILFAILFLWQIPHFLAIAMIYKDDYQRAKFPILTVVDPAGFQTSKQIVLYALVLMPLTLVPVAWGTAGDWYFLGALILGSLFLAFSISLAIRRTLPQARRLFFFSLIYLPLIGFLLAWDRI